MIEHIGTGVLATETDLKHAPDKETALIIGSDPIKAGFKIQIIFGTKRTPQGPNNVCITVWESGRHLHGGGDDLMYMCRDATEGSNLGCGKFMSSRSITGNAAYCPHCGSVILANKLTSEQYHRLSTQNLALKVEEIFHKLSDNADIYCKYSPGDIRYNAVLREKGFEAARRLRGLFIYPLSNILKDTTAGSTLQARFRAFLSA